jgi:hypothetical protein
MPEPLGRNDRSEKRKWWVRMTVSTYVQAESQEDAMQQGCDLLHEHVKAGDLGIHDTFACPASEDERERQLKGRL